MNDANLLLREDGYPNAPDWDIKARLRGSAVHSPDHDELLIEAADIIEHLESDLSAKDAEIERLKQRIAHLTDPQFLRHRGNGISLNCRPATIDLFVSRAIENKDVPIPTPEEVENFWAQIDAAMAMDKQQIIEGAIK